MTTTTPNRTRVDPALIQRGAQWGMLGFIVVSSLGGAFTHMHDWTATALPNQADWLCWSNAVISELLPMSSFLSLRSRQQQKRSTTAPGVIFMGAAMLSLCAQLSATGWRLPYDTQLLACLPAIALIVLSKVIFSDIDYAVKERERIAEEAARAATAASQRQRRDAELAAEQQRRDAELAAELAAEQQRRDAELAAELERQRRADEAEAAERIARIEAEAMTRRSEIEAHALAERTRVEAADRAAERDARLALERAEREREAARLDEVARIEAQARADAERMRAEAEAEQARAEAARIEAETAARLQAAALIAGQTADRGSAVVDVDSAPGRRRRTRTETEAIATAALAVLPADTSREDAVKAVAAALDSTVRYAREFVPDDWPAASSASGSALGLRLVAG
jgi:hypothetical protein